MCLNGVRWAKKKKKSTALVEKKYWSTHEQPNSSAIDAIRRMLFYPLMFSCFAHGSSLKHEPSEIICSSAAYTQIEVELF